MFASTFAGRGASDLSPQSNVSSHKGRPLEVELLGECFYASVEPVSTEAHRSRCYAVLIPAEVGLAESALESMGHRLTCGMDTLFATIAHQCRTNWFQ